MQLWPHVISWHNDSCFEERFALAKKVGYGGGQAWSQHAVHMAAALARPWSALAGPFLSLTLPL